MSAVEFTYRCDTRQARPRPHPADAAAAQARLEDGNRRFFEAFEPAARGLRVARRHVIPIDPADLGVVPGTRGAVVQRPFAAILGCADARVPIELVFNEGPNNLFVVRIAGNGLGADALGSLAYAADHFRDHLKLVVVLGHSGCGAVAAAVDHFLMPSQYFDLGGDMALRGVLDRLTIVVQAASRRIQAAFGRDIVDHPGFRDALIVGATATNATLVAGMVRRELAKRHGKPPRTVYGVYQVDTRRVWTVDGVGGERPGLSEPPKGTAAIADFAAHLVRSPRIRTPLGRD